MSLAVLPRDRAQEIGVGLIILAALAKPRLCLSLNVCFFGIKVRAMEEDSCFKLQKLLATSRLAESLLGLRGRGPLTLKASSTLGHSDHASHAACLMALKVGAWRSG